MSERIETPTSRRGFDRGVCLQEAARIYAVPAAGARLGQPRRWVADLPRGAWCPPLGVAGVALEIVSAVSGSSPPSALPDPPAAAAIDAWVEAMGAAAPFHAAPAARRAESSQGHLGERYELARGELLGADGPLWAVAATPALRLACAGSPTAENRGAESAAVRCLPLGGGLVVVATGELEVRVVDSATVLRRLDPAALEEALEHLGAAVGGWLRVAAGEERGRRSAAAGADDEELELAEEVMASVLDRGPAPAVAASRQEPMVAALQVIGEQEGFDVEQPATTEPGQRFDQRLARTALASNVRYREVSLLGEWWRQEGPCLLVRRRGDGEPLAALWSRGGYELVDPATGSREPIDEPLSSELAPYAYSLYAGLPDELSVRDVRRFALRGAGGDLRAILVTAALATLAGFLAPVATGAIVSLAIPDGRVDLLTEMVLLAVAAGLGAATFLAARSLATIRVASRVGWRLQAAVWGRVLRLPTGFFRRFATGDLVRRVLAVDEIRRLLTGPVSNGLLGGLFAGVSFLLMLLYDLRLALFGLAFALVAGGVLFLFGRAQVAPWRAFRDEGGRLTAQALDALTGIDKLRLAAAEERVYSRLSTLFARQHRAGLQAGRVQAAQSVMTTVLSSLGILLMLAVAGFRDSPIQLGAFSAFNVAFGQFIVAFAELSLVLGTALQAIPLLQRAAPIFAERPEVEEGREDPGPLSGHVAVRGLTFRYGPDRPLVLDGVELTLEPGELVAVVGRSGCGKSTLLRLLLGFEDPTGGAVYYDRRDLATLDLRLVRRQIGTVLQAAQLVPGSLYENIAGAAPLSDEEVMHAARQAGLAEEIEKLPMGLETYVSEDATTFSGGQRQRILIARALARRPPIVMFDEATSALDNRTQAVVSESLERLEITRLIIAHRLSTIRNADRILVLEDGRFAESGSYEELMDLRGVFWELARRQLV